MQRNSRSNGHQRNPRSLKLCSDHNLERVEEDLTCQVFKADDECTIPEGSGNTEGVISRGCPHLYSPSPILQLAGGTK